MSDGLRFAQLATFVGKRNAARYGTRRVTIGAVGWKDGARFVMGTFADGSIVLGVPRDFTVTAKRTRAGASDGHLGTQAEPITQSQNPAPKGE